MFEMLITVSEMQTCEAIFQVSAHSISLGPALNAMLVINCCRDCYGLA